MLRYRSGQTRLTVNQAPHGFIGSNPILSTKKLLCHQFLQILTKFSVDRGVFECKLYLGLHVF